MLALVADKYVNKVCPFKVLPSPQGLEASRSFIVMDDLKCGGRSVPVVLSHLHTVCIIISNYHHEGQSQRVHPVLYQVRIFKVFTFLYGIEEGILSIARPNI